MQFDSDTPPPPSPSSLAGVANKGANTGKGESPGCRCSTAPMLDKEQMTG